MKVIPTNPPNIDLIKKFFEVPYEAIFTYGNTIYNPHGGEINEALMVHEETHAKQQATLTPEKWWKFYLLSAEFRLSQEVEAYQNQYREQKKHVKDRNALNRYLNRLATDLASPMYGGMINLPEARLAIRSEEKITFDLSSVV